MGAAGGFAGWRRGTREVLLEESRAGTGSEGGTAEIRGGSKRNINKTNENVCDS